MLSDNPEQDFDSEYASYFENAFRIGDVSIFIDSGHLGDGYTADTFSGYDHKRQRLIVMKMCKEAHSRGNDYQKAGTVAYNMMHEGEILMGLAHPGIINVFEVGAVDLCEDGNFTPIILEELFDGKSASENHEFLNLSLEEKLNVFEKLAEAVDYLHKQGRYHGDLSPENFLIGILGNNLANKNREIRLIDFGLSDLFSSNVKVLHGTPGFIPYEFIENYGETVWNEERERWAFIATIYSLILGGMPYGISEVTDTSEKNFLTAKRVGNPDNLIKLTNIPNEKNVNEYFDELLNQRVGLKTSNCVELITKVKDLLK